MFWRVSSLLLVVGLLGFLSMGYQMVASRLLAYADRLVALPGVARWIAEALAEQDFLDFEEPYRQHR